jgi:hypothetical protein
MPKVDSLHALTGAVWFHYTTGCAIMGHTNSHTKPLVPVKFQPHTNYSVCHND